MTVNMFLDQKRDYVTIDGISQNDYLNLVLVANDLKPAALINFNIPRKNYADALNAKIDEHLETINKFPVLSNYQILSREEFWKGTNVTDKNGINVTFRISKNENILKQLTVSKLDDRSFGKLMGYPKDSIEAYASGKINHDMIKENLCKAIDAGITVPFWYSYISHVPEKFDLINDDISQSSKKLGETYRNFIIKNYEGLYFIIDTEHSDYYSKKNIVRSDEGQSSQLTSI